MTKNKIMIIISFFLIIILSSFVSALKEDFTITGKGNLDVYKCYIADETITVGNTGDITSNYTISLSGSGARFVSSVEPSVFILSPGKKQDIKINFRVPCSAKTRYRLNANVYTSFDLKKSLSQKLDVKTPLNIELTPAIYSKSIKPCESASYEFKLKNSGPFIETYKVIFERPFGEYVKINFNDITMNPGEETALYFDIEPGCSIYGNYTIPFSVKTLNTKIYTKTNVYLNIKRAYDYDFLLGNAYYKNDDNATEFIESIDNVYHLCENSEEIIPIKIKNNADLENSYNLKLKAPGWIKLSDASIELNKSQEKIVELGLDTNKIEGNFSIGIYAVSEKGDININKNITLIVDNCYEADISEKKLLVNYSHVKIPLSVENKGSKSAEYVISTEGGDWFSVDPNIITVAPNKISTIYLYSKPTEDTKRGGYSAGIIFSVKGTGVVYSDSIKIRLVSMNIFDKVFYNYIAPYLWYIIAFVILVSILAVLVVKRIKSRKARGVLKPIKEVKGAKKTGKEIRLTKRKIGIILLILSAIAAVASCFVFFYEGELPFISGENATKVNASFIVQNIKENVLLPVKNFFISGLNETNATIAEPVVEATNITKEPLFLSSVFTKIADFFSAYLYYILASVAGLVILAILLFILKKIEKEKITTAKFDRVSGRIILRNNRIAIGEIIIKLNKTLYNAMLVLKKIKKPTFISAGDIVYEYAEVDKKNIENSDIKEVVVRFRVKKSWLRKNNTGRRDVSLRRYVNNKWVGVNTTIISEDEGYCYYESILKELSYFAIVGKKIEIKEKPTIAKEPEEVIVVKKEEKKTEKKVKRIDYGKRKNFFKFLTVLIFIAVIAGLGYYFWSYIFGALSEIKAFAFIYKWYIVSAVSMLAAIFVVLYIVKKIKIRFEFKKKAKKVKVVKAKPVVEKKVKRKISRKQKKKIVTGILLGLFFIFIVFGIGYFAYFKQGMDMFRAEGNASEEIIAEEEIVDEESEEIVEEEIPETIIEEETIGIPHQEWHKDSDLEIDLDEYFYDPDEDELYFSAKGLKHIIVSFEDGIATLTPESNWSGTEEAVFIADDGKGGKVESNIVRLTVNDAKEESLFTKKKVSMIFTKIKEYTIVYMNYIMVGIILLVILTLFIKYRKPILDFLEED